MSNITFAPINHPSNKTVSYLKILFNDCGYTDNQAVLFCRDQIGRLTIKHLDDMSPREASQVIERLKEIRESIRGKKT